MDFTQGGGAATRSNFGAGRIEGGRALLRPGKPKDRQGQERWD